PARRRRGPTQRPSATRFRSALLRPGNGRTASAALWKMLASLRPSRRSSPAARRCTGCGSAHFPTSPQQTPRPGASLPGGPRASSSPPPDGAWGGRDRGGGAPPPPSPPARGPPEDPPHLARIERVRDRVRLGDRAPIAQRLEGVLHRDHPERPAGLER